MLVAEDGDEKEELKVKMEKLEKAPKKLSDLGGQVQLLLQDKHYCASAELKDFVDSKDPEAQRKHFIKENDKSVKKYQEQMAKFKESDEDKKKREAALKKRLDEIRARRAREDYDRMLRPVRADPPAGRVFGRGGAFDFSGELNAFKESVAASAKSGADGDIKTDVRFLLTYGVGFITMLFLGFATGFAVGSVFLGWTLEESMILSLVSGTVTLFTEAGLLIIRLYKMDVANHKQELEDAKRPAASRKTTAADRDLLNRIDAFAKEQEREK